MPKKGSGISELEKAAIHRLADAKALLDAKRWAGAMYLAGYSVECLLKTRLMRQFACRNLDELEGTLRKRNRIGTKSSLYVHELILLVNLLGCRDRMQNDRIAWCSFTLVNRWTPGWRYSADSIPPRQASDFVRAVEQTLQWLKANT